MSRIDELLQKALACYAQARSAVDPSTKVQLNKEGDEYIKQADQFQRGRTVVQAAFPKPDIKIG